MLKNPLRCSLSSTSIFHSLTSSTVFAGYDLDGERAGRGVCNEDGAINYSNQAVKKGIVNNHEQCQRFDPRNVRDIG